MSAPDKDQKFPIKNYERLCFLKNIIKNPNTIVGNYTYYDDFENVENFEKNVKYHYDFVGDKLIIGKFCMIASLRSKRAALLFIIGNLFILIFSGIENWMALGSSMII